MIMTVFEDYQGRGKVMQIKIMEEIIYNSNNPKTN